VLSHLLLGGKVETLKVIVDRTWPALRDDNIPTEELELEYEVGELRVYYGEGKYDFFYITAVKPLAGGGIEIRTAGMRELCIDPRDSGTIRINRKD
jgi:hypothetical protein